MDSIRMAQVEAAEQEVVQRLREKGLLPPDPQAERQRLEQEIVKAAREWMHISSSTAHEGIQMEVLRDLDKAVRRLEAFESEQEKQ